MTVSSEELAAAADSCEELAHGVRCATGHVRPYFVSDGAHGTGAAVIRLGTPGGAVSGDPRGQVASDE